MCQKLLLMSFWRLLNLPFAGAGRCVQSSQDQSIGIDSSKSSSFGHVVSHGLYSLSGSILPSVKPAANRPCTVQLVGRFLSLMILESSLMSAVAGTKTSLSPFLCCCYFHSHRDASQRNQPRASSERRSQGLFRVFVMVLRH